MKLIHSKRFQRWFLIIILTLSLATSIIAASNYYSLLDLATKELNSAGFQISSLDSQNSKLKDDISTKDQELQTKTQELQAKIKELADYQSQVDNLKKGLATQKTQIANQQAQLQANSSELEQLRNRPALFSFQNKSTKNVDTAKSDVESVVRAAYDEIVKVYSKPYLLNSVTITFVDSLSNPNASGEITITNSSQGLSMEIKLTDFDKNNFQSVNTIIHEIVHSFHGLAALDPVAFEEGITVAVTDQIMKNLATAGNLPTFSSYYIHLNDSQYADYNANPSYSVPADYDSFYGNNVKLNYQMVGFAWQKLASADSNFYSNFNEKFYTKIKLGQSASADLVRQTIKETVSSVGGQSINDFLNSNKAFQPS